MSCRAGCATKQDNNSPCGNEPWTTFLCIVGVHIFGVRMLFLSGVCYARLVSFFLALWKFAPCCCSTLSQVPAFPCLSPLFFCSLVLSRPLVSEGKKRWKDSGFLRSVVEKDWTWQRTISFQLTALTQAQVRVIEKRLIREGGRRIKNAPRAWTRRLEQTPSLSRKQINNQN